MLRTCACEGLCAQRRPTQTVRVRVSPSYLCADLAAAHEPSRCRLGSGRSAHAPRTPDCCCCNIVQRDQTSVVCASSPKRLLLPPPPLAVSSSNGHTFGEQCCARCSLFAVRCAHWICSPTRSLAVCSLERRAPLVRAVTTTPSTATRKLRETMRAPNSQVAAAAVYDFAHMRYF